MRAPDQPGFVGIMADGQEIDRHLVCFQDDRRATDAELADLLARDPPPTTILSVSHHV